MLIGNRESGNREIGNRESTYLRGEIDAAAWRREDNRNCQPRQFATLIFFARDSRFPIPDSRRVRAKREHVDTTSKRRIAYHLRSK